MEQRITAGSDFDGAIPDGDVILGDSLEAYPEGITGGLFDLNLSEPVFVRSVELKLGGQTAWTVHKKDRDGAELLILCGADDTDFLTTACDSFVMTAKQSLVVRTTGATSSLVCRVSVQAAV